MKGHAVRMLEKKELPTLDLPKVCLCICILEFYKCLLHHFPLLLPLLKTVVEAIKLTEPR